MRPLDFPADDLTRIDHDRYHHPCPHVQRRMELLWLAAHGVSRADLIRLTGFSRATVQRRLDDYRGGGLAAVRRRAHKGQPSKLRDHTTDLEAHFRTHPPATVAEAQRVIKERTGVERGYTQVRLFLKVLGSGTGRPGASRPRPTRSPSGRSTTGR